MDYAHHVEKNLPIGSGATEAVCKTMVKQQLCGSGMRWKSRGVKVVLSLRILVQTTNRWQQFWDMIDQFEVGIVVLFNIIFKHHPDKVFPMGTFFGLFGCISGKWGVILPIH